jgi:glutathione S-transferase
MSLTLHFHPLSSFCHKALIALYENATPFRPHIVDLGDQTALAGFKELWPIAKIPVLRDEARGHTVPEATIIIEYLERHHAGATRLVPADPDLAWATRLRDRFYDLYVNVPMQKVITDRLRPPGKSDAHGVEEARALLRTSLGMVEDEMAGKTWAMGEAFTMADCAAAPALFYANEALPFRDTHRHAAAYLDRLLQRPSYARAIAEAQPYFKLIPR